MAAIASRVAPLRKDAERRLKATRDPEARRRVSQLIAESDAAVSRGDITAAQAALLQTASSEAAPDPSNPAPTAAKPGPAVAAQTAPAAATPASAAPTTSIVVPGAAAGTAAEKGKSSSPADTKDPRVVVVPASGATTPSGTAPTAAAGPAKPVKQARSRIVTNLLQPMDERQP